MANCSDPASHLFISIIMALRGIWDSVRKASSRKISPLAALFIAAVLTACSTNKTDSSTIDGGNIDAGERVCRKIQTSESNVTSEMICRNPNGDWEPVKSPPS
jgi:hypothetical protein